MRRDHPGKLCMPTLSAPGDELTVIAGAPGSSGLPDGAVPKECGWVRRSAS
jgi:hypothetical protein